jgi:hypothetical protein
MSIHFLIVGYTFAANNLLVNGDFETNGIIGSFGSNPNPDHYPSGWEGWGLNGGFTAHWENNGSHASYGTSYTAPSNLTGDFHIWKMDWTPTAIFVYIDGVLRWSFTINGGVASDLEEFHHSFYILMNIAVGGNYTGITDVSGITAPFPARMYIDYVRVYKKAK